MSWSDFTVECWVKTGPFGRPYILAGTNQSSSRSYSLALLPSGILRARVLDSSGKAWETTVLPIESGGSVSAKPLLDDRWHLVGMMVDRHLGLMTVYIDGLPRGSTAVPTGFGAVSTPSFLVAGCWDLWESGRDVRHLELSPASLMTCASLWPLTTLPNSPRPSWEPMLPP